MTPQDAKRMLELSDLLVRLRDDPRWKDFGFSSDDVGLLFAALNVAAVTGAGNKSP